MPRHIHLQPDKKSAEAAVNMENAMMRYEFLEAIVRLGEWLGWHGLEGIQGQEEG